MTDSIRFALLGPLCATRPGGKVLKLGTRRQSAVLAGLLATPNHVVPTDALLDGIWGEDCPASGSRLLATYVYRLRRIFDGIGPVIERSCGGYRLRIEPGALDTTEFDGALASAREHQAAERYMQARTDLTRALTLWRGEPMTGLPGSLLDAERVRWREKRLRAVELRAEMGIRCGEEDLAVAELTELRQEEPLRERAAALLMVALYRIGRKVDALSVYTELDARLRTELGVEPGSELSRVHGQVLRGDDRALGVHEPAPSYGMPVPTSRDDLPLGPPRFAGRIQELEHVMDEADTGNAARIISVDGMPGVGKTAFVLEAAARLRVRHPDARLYLDLRSQKPGEAPMPPAEALRRLLSATGHRTTDLPTSTEERAALWRSTVAGRRVLIVLDNVDSADQVIPLLPSTSGCTVLIASRNRLTAIPATTTVTLRPLGRGDGRAMLAGIVGGQRVEHEEADVVRVTESCGGLPELLAGIGARVRLGAVTFADLVSELSSEAGLSCLVPVDGRDLDTVFGASWQRLSPMERDVLLALATTGVPGPPAAMESLLRANLVDGPYEGHYHLHPVVEEFVRSRVCAGP